MSLCSLPFVFDSNLSLYGEHSADKHQAWIAAYRRLTARKGMRLFGKLVTLGRLMIRAAAWNGLTTSGVEQTFTLLDLRVGLQGVGLSVSNIEYP